MYGVGLTKNKSKLKKKIIDVLRPKNLNGKIITVFDVGLFLFFYFLLFFSFLSLMNVDLAI